MKIRKIISIAVLAMLISIISTPARSQILISILLGDKLNNGAIEFGLTGGLNRTYMYQLEGSKGLNQFNLGFYFDIRLKEETGWYFYTGCQVKSAMGASNVALYSLDDAYLDSTMLGGSINRKVQYFKVPLSVKYRFKSNLFVLAGAQLGLRHKATDEFTNTIFNDGDLIFKNNTKDWYRRIDAGVTAGMGYKFRYGAMMNLGVRYYYGLLEVFKDGYGSATNSALYLFAEIPIGAKRKVKPPAE
ncbi:MAG: porin family protein [Bacteroidota bacterium]